jgi:hypothetical protein
MKIFIRRIKLMLNLILFAFMTGITSVAVMMAIFFGKVIYDSIKDGEFDIIGSPIKETILFGFFAVLGLIILANHAPLFALAAMVISGILSKKIVAD